MVDVRELPLHAALLRRDRPKLVDGSVREGHAAVPAERFDDVQIVELHGVERLLMGRADVVALEESFHDDLPVGGHVAREGPDQPPVGRNQRRERLETLDRGVLGDEHEAARLRGLDRHQSARALLESREPVLVRHVAERAIEPVGPAVIRADERLLAARAVDQLGAAMAAGVAERPDAAVVAAHGEDRDARRVARDERPGLGQRRGWTEGRRKTAEHQRELGREALRRTVVLHRLAPDRLAHVRRVVVDVVQDPLDHRPIIRQDLHRRDLLVAAHVNRPSRQPPDA